MTARRVHALFSAGVDNPALITRWRDQPELLRSLGVDPTTLDLDAMWRFAGLTGKLRHHDLREELPTTFRLLHLAGLEVDLFAAYASQRAERQQRFAPTTEGRALDLLVFLDGWLDRDQRPHAVLWDVIRHERAIGQLGRAAPAAGSSPYLRSPAAVAKLPAPGASAVPRILGEVVLHEMSCDPRLVMTALRDRSFDLATTPRAPIRLCYWRAPSAPQITILPLDELVFHALTLVDGDRTAAAVYRALGGLGRPDTRFLHLLGELETRGVITLRRPT